MQRMGIWGGVAAVVLFLGCGSTILDDTLDVGRLTVHNKTRYDLDLYMDGKFQGPLKNLETMILDSIAVGSHALEARDSIPLPELDSVQVISWKRTLALGAGGAAIWEIYEN
jgi:hypothetical protein